MSTLYDARLVHVRRERLRRGFARRIRLWLVDLDDPPVARWLRPFASFRAADHLGRPDRSIRANLTAWLAGQGVALDGGRVLMLTAPRSLGYVFNPLTVFWCYDRAGAPVCVVAEVHNTYGERHCYLLAPDGNWRAEVDKRFYVSPFLAVDGRYRMRLPPPNDALSLTVALHCDGQRAFTAVLAGRRLGAATAWRVLRSALSLMPQRVRLAIQRHGVALWLRRVPIVPRTPHVPQEGVQ